MTTRIAALTLLGVIERNELILAAHRHDTIRRLNHEISVTLELLKTEAHLSAHIKEREQKKVYFYFQVLFHIFMAHTDTDAGLCQRISWISGYLINGNYEKKIRAYTHVQFQTVGTTKLLLLRFGGPLSPGTTDIKQIIDNERLYEIPSEPECSSKALSPIAFAMKALPMIASRGRDWMAGQQLHDDLWRSYVKNDTLLSNFAGAITSYLDLEEARDILPTVKQLQKLWRRITTKRQPEAYPSGDIAWTTASNANKQVPSTIPTFPPNLPVSDHPLNHDETQLQQPEEGLTSVLAECEAEDKANLAEAYLNLAASGRNELQADENFAAVYEIVCGIWTACYEDVLMCAAERRPTSLMETVHRLRTTRALLRGLDQELVGSSLVTTGSEQREKLDSIGLRWIKAATATDRDDWELAGDWIDKNQGARDAIRYFLKRLEDVNHFGPYDFLGVDGWLLSLRPSGSKGESLAVQVEAEVEAEVEDEVEAEVEAKGSSDLEDMV